MLAVVLVALVSVLIPLSLCVVPSFARYTVFPLLSALIHRFTSAYVLPTLQVEFFFGSFDVRGKATQIRETLSGMTVSLLQIRLQPEFLKSLALAKKGTAPVDVSDVMIKEVSLHVGKPWRVVIDINNVDVHVHMIDPNATALVEVKDALAMKLGEAALWVTRFAAQKTKEDGFAQAAALPEDQRVFGFKDRIMQLVVAQIDIQVRAVNVVVDAPSRQATPTQKDTRIRLGLSELEVYSTIVHEDVDQGRELILTSPDIRESHQIRIEEFSVTIGDALEEWKLSVLPQGDEEVKKAIVTLLSVPSLELNLVVPPMARLLNLVPNYAPIPLEKRIASVQLLLPVSNAITLEKAALVRVLQDAFVPYSDYQVVLQHARTVEAEQVAHNAATEEDIAFYLDAFKKVETDTKLAAAEKTTLQEKLLLVEAKLTLNEVIKLRMKSLGLDEYFRGADAVGTIGLAECITLGDDLNVRPENIMFEKMAITLRLESFVIAFQEQRRTVAEFSLSAFGVNLNQFTLAHGDEKLLRAVEVSLEQVVFGVLPPVVSTVGPVESPVSKILYADFTRVTSIQDPSVRPLQITANVKQFQSGKQVVAAGLRGIQIVAAAHELQTFLLYVDRLSTDTGQAMAGAKPMPTLPPIEAKPASPAPSSTSNSAVSVQPADLAPFALLGGMPMDVDLLVDGCRILLLPSMSYEDGVIAEIDYESAVEHSTRHGMGKSRIEIPIGLHLVVASSKQKELVTMDVTKLGLVARYLDGVASEEDDTDYLLAPANLSFSHVLEADPADPLINIQKLSVTVPDLVMSFSDLSLTLVSSCAGALGGIQTTTPERAQQRLETKLQQDAQRQQAEIDAVVERIRRMFDEIDVDKNGHIELGELLVLLRRAKVADSLLERELEYFVRVLFKEIDRDGNGYIDFDELRLYLRQGLVNGESVVDTSGSGELEGSLNLRGGEYATLDEFEKLSGGVKPTSHTQMEEIIKQPFFGGRFFDFYESETHAAKTSLNGQRAIDVQKKVIRLLGNYEAAELCWNLLINPALPSAEQAEWIMQASMYCGGVSEYQSAAKVITRQKTDTIFAAALRGAEEKLLKVQASGTVVKKTLKLTTDLKLGNLRLVLTDPELPVQHSRGFFAIQHVKVSVDMHARDIGVLGPVDWSAIATSDASDWTALFGVRIQAMSYTDMGNAMEDIIEPWELVAAVSSSFEENGVAVLVEAEKRFQINVTPGLLKMYRALNDVLAGNQTQASWKKHKDAFRSSLVASTHENDECMLENSTGCNLVIVIGDQRVEVAADQRTFTKLQLAADGSTTIDAVELTAWGHTKEATVLPSFGVKSVRIANDSTPGVELFVSAYCRLEDQRRQRIVFKSNVFVCNHSAQNYELKYLTIGTQDRPSVTSEVIHLSPSERTALPLSVLMGITEIYARPAHFSDWIVKATLNDDLVTSAAAVQDIEEYDKAMKAKLQQRRGAIVYGVTQEDNSKLIKQLSPGVLLRRWHLRSTFEWEMSVLPPFVVRNSLPYKIEYRFVEYKVKSGNVNADFAAIEASLKANDDQLASNVISGTVSSGHDAEITGISCLAPGYLCVRLVSKTNEAGVRAKSAWSKPLLMAIHSTIEQFTIARETVVLEEGIEFSLDRLTAANLPRLVRLSCPYWVVNNTSMEFSIASAAPGAKINSLEAMNAASIKEFMYPRMTSLEHDRVSIKPIGMTGKRPLGWTALGKVPASAYSPNEVADGALKAATWSEPMNSTTVNTVGELSCGPSVFGVKIEGLYGSFEQSIALTISPRFYLQNRLKEKIFVQAFASGEAAESADNLFRTKRSPEEAKAATWSILNGETTPMYHFFPLKKGETVTSQSQKYMALSFEDAMGETWSHVIPVSTAGDSYIQLYSKTRDRHIICLASVQVIDMYVYVILSDTSGSPPYRIENFTPYQIECSQIFEESSLFRAAATDSKRSVKHGDWYAFAWSNSLAKAHKMQFRLVHPDGRAKEKKYDIDIVGYHDSIVLDKAKAADGNMSDRIEVIVQTVVDEGTRVLKFLSKELEMQRLENQDAQFEQEFEQRKMTFASSFDVRIAGLGLSLFDTLPQEVFFLSVDVVQIQKLPGSLKWDLSIFHSQIDNMLPNAKFPVILNPLDSGFSDKTAGKPPKPLLSLVLDADLAAKVGIYKMFELELHSLGLKVDLDYIVNLVKLVEPFLASDAAMLNASLQTLDRVLKRQVPPVPAAELTADGNIRHNVLYFDMLRIGALSVDLEYSITRRDIVSNAGGGNSVIFGLITQVVGLVGSNLSGSPTLSFSEIVIQRCFSTKDRLQSQLIQNFVRQAVMQAYRLIGSADIIGDPIGLVEDLGSGVVEFFKITKGELMGDSQTRGEGVKVLGKTVAQTGASTLAKFTGSLDKFVGDFAEEDESAANGGGEEKTESSSIGGGGLKFAKDLGKGFTGIFTKPVEGARKGGVAGLLSGTVQGIAGPGVVLLKQITSTSHNIALGVQSTVVDRSVFGGRRRLAKKVDGSRVVADFDEQHYRPTRLLLEVVSAQGLMAGDSCDPMCVVRIDEKPVLSTHVLYNTLNPVWQEKTQIELTGAEQEVVFVVKDSYGGTVASTIGKCAVSMDELQDDFRPPQFSSSLAQWVRTGVKPVETKKNVSNVVKEKEYTLFMKNEAAKGPGALLGLGSSKVKLSADDVQVLVTVTSLCDLQLASAGGGGMLGLGGLVGSSTPSISPLVSVHVGKHTQRTHVGKVTMGADHKAQALWNESFTFTVIKKEMQDGVPPAVLLSLKDKGMVKDATLGFANLPLTLKPSKAPVEQEVAVYANKEGSGEPIGFLKLKVEVMGATATAAATGVPSTPKSTAGGDVPKVGSQRDATFKLDADAVKAGKIRVACEFV